MSTYTVRQAQAEDAPTILGLRAEAERWLEGQGLSQWQSKTLGDRALATLQQRMADGDTWVISPSENPGEAAATVTLSGPDPDFWTAADDPDTALYLYKLIVSRAHAGHGLGDAVLDWATERAADAGRKWLRIDCWRDNERLHAYYLARGFEHVRTVTLAHRMSGALFQRPTSRTHLAGPEAPQLVGD